MIPENILFVDIQAVGSPGNGLPMEIAWKSPGGEVHHFFIHSSAPSIPPRIRQLTGMEPEWLKNPLAVAPDEMGKLFAGVAEGFVLVAHHAVYEKKWLDYLTGMDLPFLCTREMARERIPGLRSGSLRAVAGVIGHVMEEHRRASGHVLATEAIYMALMEGFTADALPREERLSLPSVPGVYRFLDAGGRTLYTGKASNLRNRVNGHFTGRARGRKGEMLSRISRIEWDEAETPFHAAVHESELISGLSPEYNRAGKITDHDLWYLTGDMTAVTRTESRYGPFTGCGIIAELAGLAFILKTGEIKGTFVENFLMKAPAATLGDALSAWRESVGKAGLLLHGKKLFLEEGKGEKEADEPCAEVFDEQYIMKVLDGVASAGALMCRRAAAVKLLAGCSISWTEPRRGSTVDNFVDNSLSDPWSQAKVRRLHVVLAELKRIYRENRLPVVTLSSGSILSGEKLHRFLALL